MLWLILATLFVFGSSISNILRKVLLKDERSDVIASAIVFQFLGAIIVGIVTLFKGFIVPPFLPYALHYILQAVLWGSSTLLLFKAYEYIEASEATIILTFESIVTILSAMYFLKEVFSFEKIIGTILIIFSVIIVSQTSHKLTLNRGVLYALASSFFAGLGVTNDTFMVHHVDALSYLTIGFLTPGLFMILVKPKALQKITPLLKAPLILKMFSFTFFYAIAGIMFFLALAVGAKASQLSPITQSSVILTILFAAMFLKERDHLTRKIFCAIAVFIGVYLLS